MKWNEKSPTRTRSRNNVITTTIMLAQKAQPSGRKWKVSFSILDFVLVDTSFSMAGIYIWKLNMCSVCIGYSTHNNKKCENSLLSRIIIEISIVAIEMRCERAFAINGAVKCRLRVSEREKKRKKKKQEKWMPFDGTR